MTRLEQAMRAANDRKMSAVGGDEGIVFADTALQDRAVFLGFDIEYGELVSTSTHIGEFYSQNAHSIGLRPLFISAWCDGLLTGLLLASLPPASEPDDTEIIGFGGGGKMSYSNPVPGGTIGRTDQGVDISAPPGTPVDAITTETLVGIIRNWYNGQPFYYFRQAGSNIYNYVAEQFSSNLSIGQTVQQGQQIGTVAPSGTGLELGWATASGQTLARATTGYTEGQATSAGQSYRAQVIQGGAPNSSGASGSPTTDLAQLWIDAGGSPALANTMAAIALAESGGQVGAIGARNSNGTYDYGLWQINSSHTQFNKQQLLTSPLYNAQAAVAVFKSQGLTAWSTYNSGAYRQYLAGAANAQYTGAGPTYGGTRPGGQSVGSGGSSVDDILQEYISLRDIPRTAPPNNKNPFQWWLASFSGNWQALEQTSQ